MYLDAANRKILEPVDYLVKASKRSKDVLIHLKLAGYDDLHREASQLNAKITETLNNLPIEEWETARHPLYREVVIKERICPHSHTPAPEQPTNGCWYYDHNVCGLPHPSPTAEKHDAAVARTATLAAYEDFDRWFSSRHVGGQTPIIPEVRQELHRRMDDLRQQQERERSE